jgi:two-component system chemotaxis response regulator CheB
MQPPPPSQNLRVLVVDDMALYRRLLTEAMRAVPRARVVGMAADGVSALEKLETLPVDFVVLDIEMPRMNGIEALAVIRERWPQIGVVIVSGVDDRAAELTVEALSRGALDFVPKGGSLSAEAGLDDLGRHLRRVVTNFRTKRAIHQFERHAQSPASRSLPPPRRDRPNRVPPVLDAVALAASTGGPQVLDEVLAGLPGDLGLPVFVVQHMPPPFTAALARRLDLKSALTVCEARDGQIVEPGVVYVAPGGRHMVVRGAGPTSRIGIVAPQDGDHCRPSADVLFRSLATAFGGRVLVAIMTGMGDDGLAGVRALRHRGAYCLSQEEATCVVYGMPRAVSAAGLSDEEFAPPTLAARLASLVKARASSTWVNQGDLERPPPTGEHDK